MNTRLRLAVIALGAFLVVVIFTFPLWRPLFVDDVINEAFPGLNADQQAAFLQLPADQQAVLLEMRVTDIPMALEAASSLLNPDQQATDDMPEMTNPVILVDGSFTTLDAVHGASGTATVYQLPDNSRVLRFENFRSTNGPDLHVILTKNANPLTRAEVGEDYVDLGQLKGNVGNQNYEIPAEVDLSVYRGVVIYCVPFHVVFSTAPLS